MNYSLQDLLAVSLAFILFPLFVFVPGYMFALAFNVCNFRKQTPLLRSLFSLPLSIAVAPIVTFLVATLSSTLLWALFGLIWLSFAAVLIAPWFPKPYGTPARARVWGPGLLIGFGVAAVLCFSLIDLQVGHRFYVGVTAYDYNFRAAVIDSLTRRGLPPISPFLHPGTDAPFRYHYFWFLICSLVDALGGKLISARQAQIAGTAWVGVSLCATVAVYLRFFHPKGGIDIRKRTLAGILLLAVSGLDIIPVFLKSLSSVLHHSKLFILGSAEWWSADPVTSWAHALLWVPHHVAGVIACLTGFLILWNLEDGTPIGRRWTSWVGAALAFASASGLSIHVTFAFACAMLVWGALTVRHRWFRMSVDLAAAGSLSLVIAFPFLHSLVTSGAGRSAAGGVASGAGSGSSIPLSLGVRQFRPLHGYFTGRGSGPTVLSIVDFLALPLNYFMELGFFAIVLVLFLRRPPAQGRRARQYELAITSMVGTVLLVCTFVRSTVIGNNDLGWRGILLAQFLLVIVAADYLSALKPVQIGTVNIGPRMRILLVSCFCLGLLPSAFEVLTQRFHQVLVDANVVAPDLEGEGDFGRLGLPLRRVYNTLDRTLPKNAIVQHDPSNMQNIFSGLYADRQRVLMGSVDYTSFGGNMEAQERARGLLRKLFEPEATEQDRAAACSALGIGAIVVTDRDPVWRNKQSWVWNHTALVEDPVARAISCSNE